MSDTAAPATTAQADAYGAALVEQRTLAASACTVCHLGPINDPDGLGIMVRDGDGATAHAGCRRAVPKPPDVTACTYGGDCRIHADNSHTTTRTLNADERRALAMNLAAHPDLDDATRASLLAQVAAGGTR